MQVAKTRTRSGCAHWAGSEVPPLNNVARAAAAAKRLDLIDTARLFALLNMSMADSLIAGFEAKYSFNYWRPMTAIRNAAIANNAGVSADPNWEPLLVTPPHQEYPSAHCLGAGAAVAVLQDVLGGDQLASGYVYPPLGIARRWQSFSQIDKEIGDSRVWGGIHFRTAVEHGSEIGRQIAEAALKTQMRPKTN
jgi:PAP2 superfamily